MLADSRRRNFAKARSLSFTIVSKSCVAVVAARRAEVTLLSEGIDYNFDFLTRKNWDEKKESGGQFFSHKNLMTERKGTVWKTLNERTNGC